MPSNAYGIALCMVEARGLFGELVSVHVIPHADVEAALPDGGAGGA